MARWSWSGVEPLRGTEAYALHRDAREVARIEFGPLDSDTAKIVPAALNAMCAALGQTVSAGAAYREGAAGDSRACSAPADTPNTGPSTLQQQRSLHIEMAKLGGKYRERAFRLQVISNFVGREVTSTKQLTFDEADRVLVRTFEKLAEKGVAA